MDSGKLEIEITDIPPEIQALLDEDATAEHWLIAQALTIWERLRINYCTCKPLDSIGDGRAWFIPVAPLSFGGPSDAGNCRLHGQGPWNVGRWESANA